VTNHRYSDAQRWFREALVRRLETCAAQMNTLLSEIPRGSLRYWTLTVATREDYSEIFHQASELARVAIALGRLRVAGRKSILEVQRVLEEIREQDPQIAQGLESDVVMALQIAGYDVQVHAEPVVELAPPIDAAPIEAPVEPNLSELPSTSRGAARSTSGFVSANTAKQRMPWEY